MQLIAVGEGVDVEVMRLKIERHDLEATAVS